MESNEVRNFLKKLFLEDKLSTITQKVNSVEVNLRDEVLHIANVEICRYMKGETKCRKITEAKMDIYDCFFTRVIEYAEEIILPFSPVSFESVGSRAEGLGNLANDTDLVTLSTMTFAWFPTQRFNPEGNMLVIDVHGCHPGYCKLKFHEENRIYALTLPTELTAKMDGDIFLCNNMNTHFLETEQNCNTFPYHSSVQGPALSNMFLKHDWVSAFRCKNSRPLFNAYIKRTRTWPSQEVLHCLEDVECSVVATKHSSSINSELEFRISFASAEKFLIRNLNDNQFVCYGFLKVIKWRIEKDVRQTKELLKSYFTKTAFLWICENLELSVWEDTNFLKCVSLCLSYLQYCFRRRNLPQLFMPENNLIDHVTAEDCDKMADALDMYRYPPDPKMFLRSCCDDTFEQHFKKILSRSRRYLPADIHTLFVKTCSSQVAVDQTATLTESTYLPLVLHGCTAGPDSVVCDTLYHIITNIEKIVPLNMVPCMTSVLYRLLADIVHRHVRFVRNNNKLAEELYTRGISLVYPVSHFDDQGLSGNTNLAFFHYLNQDFAKAFMILNKMENVLLEADLNSALSIHLVSEDLPRLWSDDFLTRFVETFGIDLQGIPVKCNALALYVFCRCIDELYYHKGLHWQSGRLKKIKRSVLTNEKKLESVGKALRLYTDFLLDACKTILNDLMSKLKDLPESSS